MNHGGMIRFPMEGPGTLDKKRKETYMTEQEKHNAQRLAFAIERHADPGTIRQLARLLNYESDQLRTDIEALARFVSECSQATEE